MEKVRRHDDAVAQPGVEPTLLERISELQESLSSLENELKSREQEASR